jgi:hypothetical protein
LVIGAGIVGSKLAGVIGFAVDIAGLLYSAPLGLYSDSIYLVSQLSNLIPSHPERPGRDVV